MALRDQPYLPLYVQDFLTDEKLNLCGYETQGVFIKIMCILHKQETYGKLVLKESDKILFKQTVKQNSSRCLIFAFMFSKLLPIPIDVLERSLEELIDRGVMYISGDEIAQKRMVKDGQISEARSSAGKKGGGNPNLHKQNTKHLFKQNPKQNTENENEYEYEIENAIKDEVEVVNKKPKKQKDELKTAIFNSCKKIWLEFYQSKTHLTYNFSAKDAGCLATLIKKITFTIENSGGGATQENITTSFQTLLDKLPAWYRDKLELSLINSQYNSIIAQIKKDTGQSQVEYFTQKFQESCKSL